MGYDKMVIGACAKNNNRGKGASLPQIRAFVAAANGGKCQNSAVMRAIKKCVGAGNLAQGATNHRYCATDAGRAAIKPKKAKK